MNGLVSQSTAEPLIFSWDAPRGRTLAITVFLALSLIAHAFCFYIFQIVYPPTIALLPPPARVTLITAASEEGRTLLRWIDAEDPALAFTTRRPPDAPLYALPTTEHVPSYLTIQSTFKDIPPLEQDLSIPTSQPPGAVRFPKEKTNPVIRAAKTSVSFSHELDVFGAAVLPQVAFTASNEETPRTIRFRIAANDVGEIRYCFPVNSSGDPSLDEQAHLYIARCRFHQRNNPSQRSDSFLVWGIATIEWGNDVTRRHAAPSARISP